VTHLGQNLQKAKAKMIVQKRMEVHHLLVGVQILHQIIAAQVLVTAAPQVLEAKMKAVNLSKNPLVSKMKKKNLK